MRKSIVLFSLLISVSAWANIGLATNGKKVKCYADDNQSIELDAKRATLKYTVEGESLGAKKILKTVIINNKSASYQSSVGTLVLGVDEDTFQFNGEANTFTVECK